MLQRIGRMVVVVGLLMGLVVGCGQTTPGQQDPGEPEVPENVSPPAGPGGQQPTPGLASPAASPEGGASPEASPESSPAASPDVES